MCFNVGDAFVVHACDNCCGLVWFPKLFFWLVAVIEFSITKQAVEVGILLAATARLLASEFYDSVGFSL